MQFAIIILTCIIAVILIQSSFADHYLPFPSLDQGYPESQMEDEIEFAPLEENEWPNFDWSPPNGELPYGNIAAGDLGGYFGDDEEDGSLNLRESWIQSDNNDVNGDLGRAEAKRAFNFPRRKKNQVLCRVQKAIHHHSEAGNDFFPRSYTSYSCTPVSPSQVEGSVAGHDTCYIPGENCITVEKEQLFLRRKHNTNCWSHFIEAVGAGCKCLSRKY